MIALQSIALNFSYIIARNKSWMTPHCLEMRIHDGYQDEHANHKENWGVNQAKIVVAKR